MSNKTINQALKDLYTGLGGDPQALVDNSTCSDYIEDLESAIKGAASGAQIDDTTASETTVFSSAKTEDLINGIEALPSVAVGDIGEALIVESDGEGGAQWGKGAIPKELPSLTSVDNGKALIVDNGVWSKSFLAKAYVVTQNGDNYTLDTAKGNTINSDINLNQAVCLRFSGAIDIRAAYVGRYNIGGTIYNCFLRVDYTNDTKEVALFYVANANTNVVNKMVLLTLT